MVFMSERWIRGWLATDPAKMQWSLIDAEKRSEQSQTFEIPPRHVREGIRRGDLVKLVFEPHGGQPERMWVSVVDVLHNAKGISFLGKLRNQAVARNLPSWGTCIEFSPKNIIDVRSRMAGHP